MIHTAPDSKSTNGTSPVRKLDAVIIGTGVAGLYQLHQLREQGLNVRAYDSASDVGGTWYWNRYPGARFDSESYIYQYLFSEELYKGWSWSEKFPGQPEIERWLNYVADRLDLRKDIQFNTTITSAPFDDATNRWTVKTDTGETIDTQFLVTCCGPLSAPLTDMFPGQDTFTGQLVHTGRWPKEPVYFAGKRVGVVGIGATGIQVVQTIASQVEHLTVFVRTPQYVIAMKNLTRSQRGRGLQSTFPGAQEHPPKHLLWFRVRLRSQMDGPDAREAREVLEEMWEDGSLKMWIASFAELFFDDKVTTKSPSSCARDGAAQGLEAHRGAGPFRPRVWHASGSARIQLSRGRSPPECRSRQRQEQPDRTRDAGGHPDRGRQGRPARHHHPRDRFRRRDRSLTRIDIRGRGGRSLKEDWGRDIRTTMGLQVHGYPNLFTTATPLSARGLALQHGDLPPAADRVDQRLHQIHAEPGPHSLRADEGDGGQLGGAPRRDCKREPDLEDRLVVPGIERQREASPGSGPIPAASGPTGRKCPEVAASGYQGFSMQ